jgi:magnesium chelatase subunit D
MDFPFSALVGQDQLKTALMLNAVYPAIGGVLIRGEKGTAKSTAARSLASLLPPLHTVEGCPFRCDPAAIWPDCPHCTTRADPHSLEVPVPFIDLPLGATEDRVLGTLDFEQALREGRRAFQPGLLASAHRGILYIDEVNLLPDHLVDVLLDAAAMGVNTVQREGVSVAHPARFVLIGTMNPEEGELRPQLLDRFGMLVQVSSSREPAVRAEVVRRRLAFETDPAAFTASWTTEQNGLRERIAAARECLPQVFLGDDLLTFISQLCCQFEVDGLRPDLALHKSARARAALEGRLAVNLEDIKVAAEMILPHRRKRRALEQPGFDQQRLDQHFDQFKQQADHSESGDGSRDDSTQSETSTSLPDHLFRPAATEPPPRVELDSAVEARASSYGRRNSVEAGQRGRFVRPVADENATDVALAATIRAAAQRGEWVDGRLTVSPADLHRKERNGRTGTLLLFVVDASGSMAARRRMELVKGTVLGLLRSAYEQRDEVAVIVFRGPQAELLLPPTRSVELAERVLQDLPTGGRTPLAHALVVAAKTVEQWRRQHTEMPILLVLLSDGRANVALDGTTADPWQQALEAAKSLASANVPALVLDTNAGFVRLGRIEELARNLGAASLSLEDFSAEKLLLKLRKRH